MGREGHHRGFQSCTVVVRRCGSALISASVKRSVTHCLRENKTVWSVWCGDVGSADSEYVRIVRVCGPRDVSSTAMTKLVPCAGRPWLPEVVDASTMLKQP